MIHIPILLAAKWIAGVLIAGAATAIIVKHLDSEKAKQIAIEESSKLKRGFSKMVVDSMESGNATILNCSLYDSEEKFANITIQAETVTAPFSKGYVIYN